MHITKCTMSVLNYFNIFLMFLKVQQFEYCIIRHLDLIYCSLNNLVPEGSWYLVFCQQLLLLLMLVNLIRALHAKHRP